MKNATTGECRLTPTIRNAIEWAEAEAGYEVDLKALFSAQRYAHLVRIRRLAAWYLRTQCFWSFPRIATALHRADHSTMMHHIGLENKARGLPKAYPRTPGAALMDSAFMDKAVEVNLRRLSSEHAGAGA